MARKSEWSIKLRVWIEDRGEKVLGPGRVELLEHIETLHSISAAAKAMDMSYRRAWTLVRDMNEAAKEPLVELATGGSGGGGATLTKHGMEAVALYQKLLRKLGAEAEKFQNSLAKM